MRPVEFNSAFLNEYFNYVDDTESPRLHHAWCALSGMGACLGRRVYFPFGVSPIYANMYIALVGPPAVRKSTSITIMKRLLQAACEIKLAPDDTSGQRQGLISAMTEELSDEEQGYAALANDLLQTQEEFIKKLEQIEIKSEPSDRHVMYAIASELNVFLGQNSHDMLNFLIKVFDGEDYDYRLKRDRSVIAAPLMSILGGTTPTQIAKALPPEAIGQGFMSRWVFVYGGKKYKNIPRPNALDLTKAEGLQKAYQKAYYDLQGHSVETIEARKAIDQFYDDKCEIEDNRFLYYIERRHMHFIKLCMAFAAARGTTMVEIDDVNDAKLLLKATEKYMPEALGEYGLSPLSTATQRLMEFLQMAREPIGATVLYAAMSKDMKQIEFMQALRDLTNAGKIVGVRIGDEQKFIAKLTERLEFDEFSVKNSGER